MEETECFMCDEWFEYEETEVVEDLYEGDIIYIECARCPHCQHLSRI